MKNLTGLLLLLITALLWSCKPRELPKEKETITITKVVTEVKRDTLIQVKADSSFYAAMIECQNGKPVLKPNSPTSDTKKNTSGKNLQPPNVSLNESGKLEVSCQYLKNELQVALTEKRILEQQLREKTIVPPPEYIEKQLSWWQKLWLTLGKILSASLLVYILYKIPWKALLRL